MKIRNKFLNTSSKFGDRTGYSVNSDADSTLEGTTDFTYDTREQLTQETSTRGPGYTYNNTYTHSSNPTTNPWTFRGSSRTYNSNNQITNSGYSYDYNGNPTTYKSDILVFDEENRLNNYRTSPGVTYGYNGDGLRAWKQVGTDLYYYLYDGEQLVCEYKIVSGDLHLQNFYTWGADGLFNKVTPDDTSQLFYLYDPQGSVAVQIDDSEDEQNYSIFDAWGNLTEGTVDNIGYNGKYGYYSDSDTGLVLCTHRYYDPSNGKWLTRDPIGYDGGLNLYGYVDNDVENEVDPSGYITKKESEAQKGFAENCGFSCRRTGNGHFLCKKGSVVVTIPGAHAPEKDRRVYDKNWDILLANCSSDGPKPVPVPSPVRSPGRVKVPIRSGIQNGGTALGTACLCGYLIIKWGGGIALAPETGGGSLFVCFCSP